MEKYESYNLRLHDALVDIQFLFVAFGALVLVPILTGLDTSVALFTAGVGTLMFQLVTRKNIPPIFLASSFAFIAECALSPLMTISLSPASVILPSGKRGRERG